MKCIIKRTYQFDKEDVEQIKKKLGGVRKIAKLLGYSAGYVCDIFTGRRKANPKFIYFLSQHIDLKKFHYYEEEKSFITL